MRTIVVDDEDLSREALVSLLNEMDDIQIIGECNNGIEAVKKVRELKPELLFLDIKMPHINGFDVLELLGDEAPATIFVTAFDQFAIKAFDTNAFDYLLKPVNPSRLKKSIERVKSIHTPDRKQIEKAIREYKFKQNIERILVREGSNVHVIALKDVLWLEAQDDYVAIKTKKNIFLKLDRLGKYEKLLDPQKFKRVHRSFIINLDWLDRIENQNTAILKTGHRIPVSRSGYSRFIK